VLLALCAGCAGQCSSETSLIRVDGSSTVFPITEAVAEQFQKTTGNARVTVGISGTGGGFQKFCRGETDISDASRPISSSEVAACRQAGVEYIEVPVAYDGIAIVVNPRNTWAEHITVEELRRLWQPEAQKRVTRWSQVREGWPEREVHLFGPGVDSGTYDYFTQAVVGTEHSSRGDFTSSEDDNVLVQGIASDELALGFFGLAYYEENRTRLKALPVDDGDATNGDGPIAPSAETVRGGTYQPLSRPLFIYVAKSALDRVDVASFVRFYLESAPGLVREVGYVPLPEQAYVLARERVEARRTGSMFEGGSQVGLSIEALLQREEGAP
jgi:phosphate transport system substrate-binding protein